MGLLMVLLHCITLLYFLIPAFSYILLPHGHFISRGTVFSRHFHGVGKPCLQRWRANTGITNTKSPRTHLHSYVSDEEEFLMGERNETNGGVGGVEPAAEKERNKVVEGELKERQGG